MYVKSKLRFGRHPDYGVELARSSMKIIIILPFTAFKLLNYLNYSKYCRKDWGVLIYYNYNNDWGLPGNKSSIVI